jgi:hypothetical protein
VGVDIRHGFRTDEVDPLVPPQELALVGLQPVIGGSDGIGGTG